MPKQQRLSRVDFASINQSRSRRVNGTLFTLTLSDVGGKNTLNKPKFACVVSKKIAANAVDRNRIRRMSKEAFRRAAATLNTSRTFVFYAKKESKKATYQTIAADIQTLITAGR